MNAVFGPTVISRLHARKRLYLFALVGWALLIASVFVGAQYFPGFNPGILLGILWGSLALSTLISTIVLDCGSCPRCEQRFIGSVPFFGSGLPISLVRTHCAHCKLSLFTREVEL